MKLKYACLAALIVFVSCLYGERMIACDDSQWTVYSDGHCAGPGVCDTAGNPGSYLTTSPPPGCDGY